MAVLDPSASRHLPTDSRCTQVQLPSAKPSPWQQRQPTKRRFLGSQSKCSPWSAMEGWISLRLPAAVASGYTWIPTRICIG